jgi:selenocysteine lyase/cysteine desulfurase
LAALPGVTVYGDEADCRGSGIVLFNVGTLPAHTVAQMLDSDYGIAVRAGLHCAPLAHRSLGSQASHQGAVRASFGKFNDDRDRAALARAIREIAAHAVARTPSEV